MLCNNCSARMSILLWLQIPLQKSVSCRSKPHHLPVTYLLLSYQGKPALIDTCLSAIFAALVIWMHRSNIKRLLNGTEKRLTLPKKADKNKQ